MRHQPHRFPQPQKIVFCRDCSPVSQEAEKGSLQRRRPQERSIQIKKRRNSSALLLYFLFFLGLRPSLHMASCAAVLLSRMDLGAFFAPGLGPTFPAMYFHPSASTGNPRSRQNAAVIHVNTFAPTRIIACISAASSPASATGPRVSANSNPK